MKCNFTKILHLVLNSMSKSWERQSIFHLPVRSTQPIKCKFARGKHWTFQSERKSKFDKFYPPCSDYSPTDVKDIALASLARVQGRFGAKLSSVSVTLYLTVLYCIVLYHNIICHPHSSMLICWSCKQSGAASPTDHITLESFCHSATLPHSICGL